MVFKIRHEMKEIILVALFFPIFLIISIFLFSVATVVESNILIKIFYILAIVSTAISTLSAIAGIVLYFAEQAVGTTLTIDDDKMQIKHILSKKEISYPDISDIHIERYKKYRHSKYRHYTEERLRMTIYLADGKNIVLTDLATDIGSGRIVLFIEAKPIPDEDVPLYNAYRILKTRI